MRKYKYFSLFTGIGGFEYGIGPEHECVGFSEIDKYAVQIYKKHYPNHKNYGDITKINEKELPDFDLLCGGFPCQSFSIAGKRAGFNDTRGTLFFDIARILKEKRPRLLLLENVKGLLSHDDGNTFKTIIATLTELGYDLQWQVLNSKNHGVPQNRERVFIVGHLRGTPRPEVFPLEGSECKDFAGTIQRENKKTKVGTLRTHKDGWGFREKKDGLSPTIPARARAREDGSGQPVILQRPRGKNMGGVHSISPTVSANSFQDNNHAYDGIRIRRLTPMECERLQGFPDNWTEGVSDTQRYKTLGNAVTTKVIRDICIKLLK